MHLVLVITTKQKSLVNLLYKEAKTPEFLTSVAVLG